MNPVAIAGYFLVSFIVHAVLSRLAARAGILSGNVEKGILALALLWPLWGELAIAATVIFVLFIAVRAVIAPRCHEGTP